MTVDATDLGNLYHNSRSFLSAKPRNSVPTSARITRRARIALREIIDELAKRDLAGTALDDLGRNRIGFEDPFRCQQDPAALGLAVHEPHATRQPWACGGIDENGRVTHTLLQSFGTNAPGGRCFGAT